MGGKTIVREGESPGHDETFLRSLVENTAEGVLTVDHDGTVVFANPAIERILGYEPAALVGSPTRRIVPDRLRAAPDAALEQFLRPGADHVGRTTVEFPAVHRDGHEVPVSVSLQAHEYDGDRLYTGLVTDVSDRRRREERLRERNRELEEFAAVLSHDLRNPLTVAEGYLDLARSRRDAEELQQVEDALDRTRQIIDDALTQARHGRVDGATVVLPFGDVMRTAWDAVPTGAAELVLPEQSWLIRADESRLCQLVENLVRNAVEHGSTSPGSHARQDAVEHGSTSPRSQAHEDAVEHDSTVTVRIGVLAAGAGFYVEDDGPGLPDAVKTRSGASSGTGRERGTGYGLRIVETVAEEHGWDVQRTDAHSGGARFEFHGARLFEQ